MTKQTKTATARASGRRTQTHPSGSRQQKTAQYQYIHNPDFDYQDAIDGDASDQEDAYDQENDIEENGQHEHQGDDDQDPDDDQEHDQDQGDDPPHAGSSAPIKRKRLTQACDPCRKKKIKCDGLRPSCANCSKLDLHCTYLPSMKKRGPRQGYIELLEKRLDKMEKMLQQGNGGIDPELMDPRFSLRGRSHSRSPSPTASDAPSGSGSHPTKAEARFFGNTSIFSHYAERASPYHSCMVDINTDAQPTPGEPQTSRPKKPLYGIKDEIPRKDILDHLIKLFFDSVYFQFPIIHPASFMKQYRDGNVPPNLLNALCAGVARFSDHPDVATTPSFLAGEPFATNVRASIVDSIDVPTVSNVQALLFLAMYEYGAARGPRAWMFGGMAIRQAQELGLNREDSSPVFYLKGDWVMRETRRRTFWACFTMDVLASSSSGRPRMMDERDCEVLLPSEDKAWHEARPVVSEMLDGEGCGRSPRSDEQKVKSEDHDLGHGSLDSGADGKPSSTAIPESSRTKSTERETKAASDQSSFSAETPPRPHCLSSFAYLIRILAILGRVSQYVNRPRPKRAIPPNEAGSEFSVIDAALAGWLKSIPSHLRYSPENFHRLKDKNEGCLIIFMNVIYHTSVVLLHRPILAADRASFPIDSNFIETSTARCANAASKVSEVLDFVSVQGFSPRVYISSFFAYPVFTTATIHITDAFATDAAVAAKARRNLSTHVKILQTMKSYWAMADKFFYIIRDLYSIQSKISSSAASGGIIVPQVVTHDPHNQHTDPEMEEAIKALQAKVPPRARGRSDSKGTGSDNQELIESAPRMVVNSKLASISSFLKSDSGLIALWRRATEMQVIDEANQEKKRLSGPTGTDKAQSSTKFDTNVEDSAQQERNSLMNQLEIQEINQEFERQWKAKVESEKRLPKDSSQSQASDGTSNRQDAKRPTESDSSVDARHSKQARTAGAMAGTTDFNTPYQHVQAHRTSSASSLEGLSSNSNGPSSTSSTIPSFEQASSIRGFEQSSTSYRLALEPIGNTVYQHSVVQYPQSQPLVQQQPNRQQQSPSQPLQQRLSTQPVQQQFGLEAAQARAGAAGVPVSAGEGLSQHLMNIYSQQHHQQEAESQAIDLLQNANIQRQQRQLQLQQQRAATTSSLAFGPSSETASSSFDVNQQQQQQQQQQLRQQTQAPMLHPTHSAMAGMGLAPLVYGSSYSNTQANREEPIDSIFDFAFPMSDISFLSSSFQLTPMMFQEPNANNPSVVRTSASSAAPFSMMTGTLASNSLSQHQQHQVAMQQQQQQRQHQQRQQQHHQQQQQHHQHHHHHQQQQQQQQPQQTSPLVPLANASLSIGSATPPMALSPTTSTTSSIIAHGRAGSDTKSPPNRNISPNLHSLMLSDDTFADMQSTPVSLIRTLQQRQEIQQQQQNLQPLLNPQNSLIFDDYFQWGQFLPQNPLVSPTSAGGSIPLSQHPQQPLQQPSASSGLVMGMEGTLPGQVHSRSSAPSFS